ncbi:hypothetical protein BDV33DRAFT_166002 [Aspergillus novoparasiticus]|uniref:Uncharacterized protein n=1 Tax=Aspergillus novoparasiticus TaxID=986946 RepID=A0A5N6F4Q2_9EURO|nr:hypothetical protein BDV33DRAFT_166002 [Aspergillus novoparasiticus]
MITNVINPPIYIARIGSSMICQSPSSPQGLVDSSIGIHDKSSGYSIGTDLVAKRVETTHYRPSTLSFPLPVQLPPGTPGSGPSKNSEDPDHDESCLAVRQPMPLGISLPECFPRPWLRGLVGG